MSKEEILKTINDNIGVIVETAISLGYYNENQKKEMISRINHNLKNGIIFDSSNPEIYGAFVASEKAIHLNDKVLKDKLTLLIYFAHELIHAIDFDGKNHGFQSEDDYGIGINEGATQRKAENIVKKILQISPEIKMQNSIGCNLETDLDEYQIEDRFNQLYAKALGISFEDLLRKQGLHGVDGRTYLQKIDALYSSGIFSDFAKESNIISLIDSIYQLQEKTWFDKEYDVNQNNVSYDLNNFGQLIISGLNSRDYYIKEIQEELVKLFVYRNIMEGKITNEKGYRELVEDFISGFIIKDTSYLEKYSEYVSQLYNDNMNFISNQNQYNEIENWLLKNVPLGDKVVVSINLDYDDDIETIIKNGVEVYIRENDSYYIQKITFAYDEQNNIRCAFGEKETIDLKNIVEHMEHNQCDGNYQEYIDVLLKLQDPLAAKRIAIRQKMFQQINQQNLSRMNIDVEEEQDSYESGASPKLH